MPDIEPPDIHHLSAAIGWLELGNAQEAAAELARIQGPLQEHPDVLEVRWQLLAQAKAWTAGVAVAEALVKVAPKRASGFLHLAYSLRRARDLQAAWDTLLPAAEKFPKEWLISYNLSCYACQLGRLDEARAWLKKAFARGDRQRLKAMALADPDLAPLADEVREM